MFEILEHTADIGFRARGRTRAEVFENAALALVSVAVELDDIEPRQQRPLSAAGADPESLLVNWLSEVLYSIDGEGFLYSRFRVAEISSTAVAGTGFGEPRDPARHHAKLIVKGVTYHQLRLAETPQGWCAEVYLDI